MFMIADRISYTILKEIGIGKCKNVSAIFKKTEYSYATILKKVRKMEKMGLVEMKKNGRNYELKLTDKGKKALDYLAFLMGEKE